MLTEAVRVMYDFNTWANERVLARAAELTSEQYTAAGSASHSSVRETLVHTMWGQALWLSRWQGLGDVADEEPEDYETVASLRDRWREIDAATHAFVAELDEDALQRDVRYRIRGVDHAQPLWTLMLHQVNHATQHRSEVAMMLTGDGLSPGPLDLVIYLHGRAAQQHQPIGDQIVEQGKHT